MRFKAFLKILATTFIAVGLSNANATAYQLPTSNNDTVIGALNQVTAQRGDTLVSIAKQYDLGLNSIVDANPGVKPFAYLTAGQIIHLPTFFILPPMAKKGIIVNLPEMRLYYFTEDGHVRTYPVGIGKIGKTIPIEHTAIARKKVNPSWIPPADIREFNESQGITLPKIMPAGPDNPLGPFAIYLKIPTFLIHSTIYPESVGRRASFGCIRMHESDIKEFFPIVTPGTPVVILDLPTKVGLLARQIFLETHDPLEEHSNEFPASYAGIINAIQSVVDNRAAFIDWQLVADLATDRDGIPHEIGFVLN